MIGTDEAVILRTTDERDLEQIRLEHVQAVVVYPTQLPDWFSEVSSAVAEGALRVPRTILPDATRDDIAAWFSNVAEQGDLADGTRHALLDDVLALVDRQQELSGASRFMFRALTDTPSRHCGFHVDTVPPGAPAWGLLRVYGGAGTDYVLPDNVTNIRGFYRYLSRRERLVRDLGEAAKRGDTSTGERLLEEVTRLDEERAFLRRPLEVESAPAGALVAFKHLDASLHWSDHPKALAWIHCSPMAGDARLVVNITARSRRSGPRARATLAR